MTIEEKIIDWIALASNSNQVTGVKLAEILTEMNDVIAIVNANNQALIATNQQMQADITALNSAYSDLVTQLNSHVGNTGVHLIAGDRGRLSAVGATYFLTEGLVENGLTFTQQTFKAQGLKGFGASGTIMNEFDFNIKLIQSINNTFKIQIWAAGIVPLIVNLRLNKALQLSSPPTGDYDYTFDFPAQYMPTTQEEAIQRTVGMKVLFSHVYGNLA